MDTNRIILMILEDESSHAEAIRRALAASGTDAEIQVAGTLREYRERVAALAPDIALVDLNLPDGRAMDILTSPPEEGPFPVLVMTSYGNEQTAVEAMKAGALDYMVKSPESFAAVPQILQRALREWKLLQERKQAEETLRESEELFRAIIDTSPDGFVIMDLAGTLQMVSPAILAMRGCERKEEMLGHSNIEFFPPEDWDHCRSYVTLIQQGVTPGPHEFRVIRADGRLLNVETNGVLIRGADGQFSRMIFVVRDITERKRAEEKEREMEQQLLRTQKLESLGVLAGGIAHDFNNLLMAMLGNMDLALHDLPNVSPVRTNIEDTIKAIKRAADLTRQMLAYSGKGRFIIADLDLSELVEENTRLLTAALSKSTLINLQLGKSLPPISADAGQIQQVVMNLITNASESLGDKAGVVALSTGVMDCDEGYLSRSRIEEKPAPGRFVFLEVADTGCGMDEETRGRLFDPFFTTKFTGRGLGMSAGLGIVRGHSGAIMVESEVGKGTTVRVLFPVSKTASVERGPKEKAATGRIRDAGKSPLSGTVLIVDDEEMVRAPCAAMVTHAGYRALTAANGDEAVALFLGHADEIVCVILDLTMPGMDGVATFEALRRIRQDVRVILSSGYNEQEATQRFLGKGLAGFVKKPYEMETLLAELHRVMKN